MELNRKSFKIYNNNNIFQLNFKGIILCEWLYSTLGCAVECGFRDFDFPK